MIQLAPATAALALVAVLAPAGMAAVAAPVGAPIIEAQARMPEPPPEPQMRMPVPGGPPSQLRVRGCWRSNQILYGRYALRFCLDRSNDGSYRVEGGGLSCRGDLDWVRSGSEVSIRFNRGRCNRNTDWSRDRITCRVDDYYGQAPGVLPVVPAQARMPVPGDDNAWRMNCVYRPSTGGFGPMRFTARRID